MDNQRPGIANPDHLVLATPGESGVRTLLLPRHTRFEPDQDWDVPGLVVMRELEVEAGGCRPGIVSIVWSEAIGQQAAALKQITYHLKEFLLIQSTRPEALPVWERLQGLLGAWIASEGAQLIIPQWPGLARMIRKDHAVRANAMFNDIKALIDICGCPVEDSTPSYLDGVFDLTDRYVRLGLQDKVHRVQYAWEQSTTQALCPGERQELSGDDADWQ